MSLLQNPDFVIHRLRTRYLHRATDGASQRVITITPISSHRAIYKSAGWQFADIKRSYSPPITIDGTGVDIEYHHYNKSAAHTPTTEGEVRFDLPKTTSSEQKSINENSDGSDDDSELEDEIAQATGELMFAKVPVRPRGDSGSKRKAHETGTSISRPAALKALDREIQRIRDDCSQMGSTSSTITYRLQNSPTSSSLKGSSSMMFHEFDSTSSIDPNDKSTTIGFKPPTFEKLAATSTPLVPDQEPISALTLMIQEKNKTQENPLVEQYAKFSGKGEARPLTLRIYRPTSKQPNTSFEVILKRDATVAEAIGFSLLRYREEQREPALENALCDANKWTLRIVEDDGEIDVDFPALDRTRVEENELLTPRLKSSERSFETQSLMVQPATTITLSPASSAVQPRKAGKPTDSISQLLRIHFNATTPLAAQTTTMNVIAETYLADVLDQVCKKKQLDKALYALRILGTNIIAPIDRTVQSLQGKLELELVKKDRQFGGSSINPHTPIGIEEKSMRIVPMDFITNTSYQKWTVWRRGHFMGRHERTLAIDGDYIHIMPPDQKTMFEAPKTIIVLKARETKRYDFESYEAAEIATKVRALRRNFPS
ncbi:Stress-activated map kinase-interacting protein 1 [Neolecta irregularis DAH-3]|uniref:Stress-activated map kinase-interacting protein 1 n=1 Tax=Neolecta irregularis (strain DAH-3) TaxID=1198029 RepID=A0A1U7LIH9_NEOID|nr:Stress-activated map kinase-interacting protein 1 [Neolecta irregularis DAH-3]|eukprot:OLL22449.1 Stress-activated map kinase-interacting protein 1 [Neolecta irregularis DAH-3]